MPMCLSDDVILLQTQVLLATCPCVCLICYTVTDAGPGGNMPMCLSDDVILLQTQVLVATCPCVCLMMLYCYRRRSWWQHAHVFV